ncbi:hypothetical protein [Bacillus cereus]|uniref:hypothetical protein n=1 Tax=Bacillus cereus TaxID=1396 RepID=UPI003980B851
MFKEVKTLVDHTIFNKIWKNTALEEGYIFEQTNGDTERYFLVEEDTIVGTIEFIKYNPKIFSTVEQDFPFIELSEIRENFNFIWEIDKVCILRKHRKMRHIQKIFHLLASHAEKKHHLLLHHFN